MQAAQLPDEARQLIEHVPLNLLISIVNCLLQVAALWEPAACPIACNQVMHLYNLQIDLINQILLPAACRYCGGLSHEPATARASSADLPSPKAQRL